MSNNKVKQNLNINSLTSKDWEKVGFKLKINTYIFLMIIATFYVVLAGNYFILATLTICGIICLLFKKNVEISLKSILYITIFPLITTIIIYRTSEFNTLAFDFTRIVFRHNIYTPFILMVSMLLTLFYKNNKNLVIICAGPILSLAMCSDWSSTLVRKTIIYKLKLPVTLEMLFYATVILSFAMLIKIIYTYYHPQRIKSFSKKSIIQIITIAIAIFFAASTLIIYEKNRVKVVFALQRMISMLTSVDKFLLYGNNRIQGINNKLSLDGSSKEFMGKDNAIVMRVQRVYSEDKYKKFPDTGAISYLRGNSYAAFESAAWLKGTFKTEEIASASADDNTSTFYLNRQHLNNRGQQFKIYLESTLDNMIYIPSNCYQVKTVAEDLIVDYGGNVKLNKWSASSDYDVSLPIIKDIDLGFNIDISEIKNESFLQYLKINAMNSYVLKKWLTAKKNSLNSLKKLSFQEKLDFVKNKFSGFTYDLKFYDALHHYKIKLNKKVHNDPDFKEKLEEKISNVMSDTEKNYLVASDRKAIRNLIKNFRQPKKQIHKMKAQYSWLKKYIKNYPPVDFFINNTKSGHCEMFATTTALSLRLLDVPTRYVTGYMCVEKTPFGYYVVRQRNAHAWVEAYNTLTQKWYKIDNTPGDGGNENASQEWTKFAKLKEQITMFFKRLVANFKKGNLTNFIGTTLDKFLAFLKGFFTNTHSLISFILFLGLIAFLILVKIKGIKWFIKRKKKSTFSPIYNELKKLEKTLVLKTNKTKSSSQSYYEFFKNIELEPQLKKMLENWCNSFYTLRYSKAKVKHLKLEEILTLQKEISFINKQLKKNEKQ